MLTAAEIADFADPPAPTITPWWRLPPYSEALEPQAKPAENGNQPPVISCLVDIAERPGFAYVATPYTNFKDGRDEAAFLAGFYSARLMDRGLKVFSPIAHSHAIVRAGGMTNEVDHDFWVEADKPFVDAATSLIVVMMDGWTESRGVQHEIDAFIAAFKPILYVRPEDLV